MHFLHERAIPFWLSGWSSTSLQRPGNESPNTDAQELFCGGRCESDVFPNQRDECFVPCSRSLLQKPIKAEEPRLVPVSKAERFHPLHMVPHGRTKMATITDRRTERIQGILGVAAQQRPCDRSSSSAPVFSAQFGERVVANDSATDEPVEVAINPLSAHQCCLDAPFIWRAQPRSNSSKIELRSFADEGLELAYQTTVRPPLVARGQLANVFAQQRFIVVRPSRHRFPSQAHPN